ncbi:hypothetical protein FJZ26_04600 [Candidatus Parvarchaeota archaeon]|nr:hypothetical protein [Candidatus Parvarchaeota archaeon]
MSRFNFLERLPVPKAINKPLEMRIRVALRQAKPTPEHIAGLAKNICEQEIPKGNFGSRLTALFDLTATIDKLRIETIGAGAPSTTFNDITTYLILYFLRGVDIDRATFDGLDQLGLQLRDANCSIKIISRSDMLSVFAGNLCQARIYASSLSIADGSQQLEAMLKQFPDLDLLSSQLVTEMNELRKFGLKTSYFQDGIMNPSGHVWLFMDPQDIPTLNPTSVAESEIKNGTAARIFMAQRTSIIGSKLTKIEQEFRPDGSELQRYIAFNFTTGLNISLGKDGELDCSTGIGILPLREIFEKAGKETEYSLFRLSQIMRLYDLVVPLSIVSKTPSLPATSIVGDLVPAIARAKKIATPQLLLPRVKFLTEQRPLLASEGELEVEQAAKETEKRTCRRATEVAGFARRLPKNYKVSKQAQKEAEKAQVPLEEGETFVKKHIRGTGELQVPKAKRRLTSDP